MPDSGAEQAMGAQKQPPSPQNVHLCSRCRRELYDADRGYGSTAWACPEHGFDRQIISAPILADEDERDLVVVARSAVFDQVKPGFEGEGDAEDLITVRRERDRLKRELAEIRDV